MKCFYSNADAVGLCKSCGRGLSLAHAAQFERGLACRNRCEADVQRLLDAPDVAGKLAAIERTLDRSANGNAAVSAVFSILAGAAFIYFTGAGGVNLPSFMGGTFIVYGLWSLVRAFRARRRGADKS